MAAEQYEKRIKIVVFGTDPKGEMFQEDTATLVVAANWAKVRLRHLVANGAELIVFNKENGSQAEFVVQEAANDNEVLLALRDRSVDLWQLDFGDRIAEPEEGSNEHVICSACGTRECVRLTDDQIFELMGAGSLKRYCAKCMAETRWEEESVVEARIAAAGELAVSAPAPAASRHVEKETEAAPAEGREVSVTDQLLHHGPSGADRRTSRRIYLKTLARIRRVSSSEIVEPINVSRGGICFQSRASYELDEVVWVALHYRHGDANPLETPSRVVRITRNAAGRPPSYGVSFQL